MLHRISTWLLIASFLSGGCMYRRAGLAGQTQRVRQGQVQTVTVRGSGLAGGSSLTLSDPTVTVVYRVPVG